MPVFQHKGKTYYNPVEFALDQIGGRWKMPILWRLGRRPVWRYGELKNDIVGISHKMLSQQLRQLEEDLLIHREVYPVIPPKVEYSLTEKGRLTLPAIEALRSIGSELREYDQC